MKNCLFCKHFYFDSGSPYYGELTPGYGDNPMSMGCELFRQNRPWQGFWEFQHAETTEEEFRAYMTSAETCPDYWDREIPASDMLSVNFESGKLHIIDKIIDDCIFALCGTTATLSRTQDAWPDDDRICKNCMSGHKSN